MVKLNKEAPLYMFKSSTNISSHAIDIKECARDLKNTISALSNEEDGFDGFTKKNIVSSNPDEVSVSLNGDYSDYDSFSDFNISVEKIATPQINLGEFLPSSRDCSLPSGDYSFDIEFDNVDYQIQFYVGANDTNKNIQDRIGNVINNSNIDLEASLVVDNSGNSALKITSAYTGEPENQKLIFSISEESTGPVEYLGLDTTIQRPSDSLFYLNNIPKSSHSNTFTIDKNFEITLKSATSNHEPVKIGFKTDTDSIMDNVADLVNSYNNVLKTAYTHKDMDLGNSKLVHELSRIAKDYNSELEAIGLNVSETSYINIEEALLYDAVSNEDNLKDTLETLNSFKNTLEKQASHILLNPMDYVNKTMVAYKNPYKTNFSSPYTTSVYSGMMFNGYC